MPFKGLINDNTGTIHNTSTKRDEALLSWQHVSHTTTVSGEGRPTVSEGDRV